MEICLSKQQIEALTGKKRVPAQIRVLAYLGIDYRRRPDGSLLVYSQAAQPTAPGRRRDVEPRWGNESAQTQP